MPANLTIWHNRRDTLLRVTRDRRGAARSDEQGRVPRQGTGDASSCTVHIPVGISPGTLRRHNIAVEYTIDNPDRFAFESDEAYERRKKNEAGGVYSRLTLNVRDRRGGIRRIAQDHVAHLRYIDPGNPDPKRIRPYLEMARVFKTRPERHHPAYYEAVLRGIPVGARLRYRIKVTSQSRTPDVIPSQAGDDDEHWFSVYVVTPTFGIEDIVYCVPRDQSVPDVNLVYWKPDPDRPDLLHLRFDFVDLQRALCDFELKLERNDGADRCPDRLLDTWMFDGADPATAFRHPLSQTWRLSLLPVIHQQFDYVTLTLADTDLEPFKSVWWRGDRIADRRDGKLTPKEPPKINPVRLMFIHYANQALNDMFEAPNKNYSPPRTYIQTTMRDDLGTYSSRPTSNETGIGDGYSYVIETHVKNRLLPFSRSPAV
jgi:hypothetical protein